MVYRLGKRSRRRFERARRLGFVFSASTLLIAGGLSPLLLQKRTGYQHSGSSQRSGAIGKGEASLVRFHRNSKKPPIPPTGGSDGSTIPTPPATTSCSGFGAAHVGLSSAQSPELRTLAKYESLCQGAVANRSSFFAPTPRTQSEAKAYAVDTAVTLKEYAKYGVQPLVFMEPTDDAGNLDLAAYRDGAYDTAISAYFAALKSNGVTDAMMGLWIALPEGNIPVWSTTDPAIFAADVTKVVQIQKNYFPTSQAGIMLDSQSYPIGGSWETGTYVSWLPYVQGIPSGLLDTIGLQGFPWVAPAGEDGSVYDPAVYLQTGFLAEAANSLSIKNMWFNTGTFGKAYTNSAKQRVTVGTAARQNMLNGVVASAQNMQAQGFSVAIHLFAEDKSSTDEAIDWSYGVGVTGRETETTVFASFANYARITNIPIWLFDPGS